jgi:uncharacterized protein (TIRG00374 family)
MRRLISLGVSFLIVAVLWYSLDAHAILVAMRHARIPWVLAGLAMVIPLTAVTAWRFSLLSRSGLQMRTSVRLSLAASTLNLVLPSKMGDLAKAWVLHRRHGWEGERATVLVVFEKLADMASLLALGVLALVFEAKGTAMVGAAIVLALLLGALLLALSPAPLTAFLLRLLADRVHPKAGTTLHAIADQWVATTQWFWGDARRARITIVTSLGLWAGHLFQIWLFAHSLGNVPVIGSMAAGTLAILVGLLPFTIAGIGSRDAALVFLFAPWLSAPQGAALGMLATMRYLLPAIAGLPFVHDFWQARRPVTISQTQRS